MEFAASSVKFSLVLSAGIASLYPSASSSELWYFGLWLLTKPIESRVPTLGMPCPAAPEPVYLHQLQQPPSASHIDCPKYSGLRKRPTIAMTPLTLKGDIMMLPGSSFSCWYSRLPNTCRDWCGVFARVPTNRIWRCKLLLPCFRWQQQPPGWLHWSCPTWCDCSLEETEELTAGSGNRKNRTVMSWLSELEMTYDLPTIIRDYMAHLNSVVLKYLILWGYDSA